MRRPAFLRPRRTEVRHGWWCEAGTDDREQCTMPCRHTYVPALTVNDQRVTPMVTESPNGPIVELWTDGGRILALDRREAPKLADQLVRLGCIANGQWPDMDYFVAD